MALPSQADWVVDSSTPSHMSSDNGSVSPVLSLPYPAYITVSNGAHVLVYFYSNMHLCLPSSYFVLKSVLHVPTLIQNLIFVRQFIRGNAISIECDPLVFLLRTSRPGVRSFTAIARATSTPSHLPQSPYHTKHSSPMQLSCLFGMLALVIPVLLFSINYKAPAP
jgi:hypothetical protein